MSFKKYLKYTILLLPIIFIIYFGRKHVISKKVSVDELNPIEPSHSHDYAYKRAYLNPIHHNNESCRANRYGSNKCMASCNSYHYNFPDCVYKQPEYVALSAEDGKESNHSKAVKFLNYY